MHTPFGKHSTCYNCVFLGAMILHPWIYSKFFQTENLHASKAQAFGVFVRADFIPTVAMLTLVISPHSLQIVFLEHNNQHIYTKYETPEYLPKNKTKNPIQKISTTNFPGHFLLFQPTYRGVHCWKTRKHHLRSGQRKDRSMPNGVTQKICEIHLIGLRENLQETMVFAIKYRGFL